MSSRKHWPSMFMKSKSSTEASNPLQETSHSSAMRRPYSEGATLHNHGRERERTPPRARSRWNPKPEQIRILEDLFRSGLVNPPREEIKSIRAQLEKFGEVADASVFYWFQNRKSRIKRRQRQLEAAQRSESRAETVIPSSTPSTPTSTSIQSRSMTDLSYTPAANTIHSNIGDQYYPSAVPVSSFAGHHSDPQAVPSAVPVSSFAGHHSDPQAVPSAVQVSSFAGHHSDPQVVYDEISNYNEFCNMRAKGAGVAATAQGMSNEEPGGVHDSIVNTNPLITVFINDNPITVPMGPLNMRAYFGDDVLLFHSSGELVLVNEWGFTAEGLNPGANYFTI